VTDVPKRRIASGAERCILFDYLFDDKASPIAQASVGLSVAEDASIEARSSQISRHHEWMLREQNIR
jgi:hypothetical protein